MARRHKSGIQKRSWLLLLFLIVMLAIYQIPLPYFYSQPGEATPLHGMITVAEGEGEEGQFHLTTIRQQRATIPLYIWAQFSEYRKIVPAELYLQEGETDEEYFHRQEMLMDSAQEASKMAAYDRAGYSYDVEYQGIRVTKVVDEMDASEHVQEGDLIKAVDGETVETLEEMNGLLEEKTAGDVVELTIGRNSETLTESVTIDTFPADIDPERGSGLGLLYPFTQRNIEFHPDVTIDAGSIGGPSAGLMFALEIYNQLVEEDLTSGAKIAGTGSIDEDGQVGRIGGIEQKIVAADNAGIDVFFAPDDDAASPSNYEAAVETAEDIGTDMVIVPVKEFDDAVTYLENHLDEKTAVKQGLVS
ncbi:PDZ domain-containing protein [Alteribacillus persepolensis]|uniref:endopeptidase La n=1 Tax=Alteribacillus persepolensis TaxID=568899 RepID=A0A1G7YE08_9BACI|nr:PDZ domain-containing protein [Alteribacillus persepolensis]SDG94603.1 PDZ domain-containing protein [Alteribacillus persepolensis]